MSGGDPPRSLAGINIHVMGMGIVWPVTCRPVGGRGGGSLGSDGGLVQCLDSDTPKKGAGPTRRVGGLHPKGPEPWLEARDAAGPILEWLVASVLSRDPKRSEQLPSSARIVEEKPVKADLLHEPSHDEEVPLPRMVGMPGASRRGDEAHVCIDPFRKIVPKCTLVVETPVPQG